MKRIFLYFTAVCLLLLYSCNSQRKTACTEPFPGCTLVSEEPQLLAPGLITGGYTTRDVAITPDGKEFYFGAFAARHYTILVMKKTEGKWSDPEIVQHLDDPKWMFIEPALSWDGNTLYFLSNKALTKDDKGGNQDIWAMDKTETGWGEPYNIGLPINTIDPEYYPSLTKDGTMYFTRNVGGSRQAHIFRSRLVDGEYQEPEMLPEQVNCGTNHFNAFIAHDESYIILPVSGREDSDGVNDYYIVFRDKEDNWSEPINMGKKINTSNGMEMSPYVTRDGKYFFFMSTRLREDPEKLSWKYLKEAHNSPESGTSSIYIMLADFINELRATAVFN